MCDERSELQKFKIANPLYRRFAPRIRFAHLSCDVSYKYTECSGTCQYCDACGGCGSSEYSFDRCSEGGGGVRGGLHGPF